MHKLTAALVLVFANVALGAVRYPRAGTQFITGACSSDADCASSCCGFNPGKCAGPVVAQERDGGCGHGDAKPNNKAAVALGFTQAAPGVNGAAPATAAAPAATTAAANTGKGSGKALGTQFITGQCASDAECASGCCGFNSGKCAGPVVAQERDGGCGHGDAKPNNSAAVALGFTQAAPGVNNAAPATAAAPAATTAAASTGKGSGKALGTQFITGQCASDAECASGCCGFNSGKCAGPVIAQERDGGCGFGNAKPNNSAAVALGFTEAAPGVNGAAPATAAAPAATSAPNVGAGSGKPLGTQFITGPCASDAECADGCCGFNSGKCAGPVVAQERDGGCGHGDAKPNDNAAKALRGRADPERRMLRL